MMDLHAVTQRIAMLHKDRKWILTTDVAAAKTPDVAELKEQGAASVMVVAGVEGVGELPAADVTHYTRATDDSMMGSIRAFTDSIETPSPELLAAVDRFDPDGDARILGAGFSRKAQLAGRPVYGARPASWGALEDKTTIDDLWDAAGITRAPSSVVPVNEASAAATQLASDLGTVWAADNQDGWHGGGSYTRWVRGADDSDEATEWFTDKAHLVRIMPFLDGIPCSIHGFVTPDGVAVFLPVELVILRDPATAEFIYAGGANFWTPPVGVRDAMRDAALSAGTILKEECGYLGAFGIDGVSTTDGFLPNELNPRLSLGHALQADPPGVPLGSIERLLVEGDIDVSSREIEDLVVASAGKCHGAKLIYLQSRTFSQERIGFTVEDELAVAVDPDVPNDGTLSIGPAAFGAVMLIRFDTERTPVGPSIAPKVIQAIDLARRRWGFDVPHLEPAPDLGN